MSGYAQADAINKFRLSVDRAFQASTAYNEAGKAFKSRLDAIDKDALLKISKIYNSRPQLLKLFNDKKGEAFPRDFVSANILNEHSGSYAVYQVFWYFFMVVVVFGLLYFIFLVLRPLPPFAAGSDLLSEQARNFFQTGGRVTPQLAKAAAVTVAALGIGTAVAGGLPSGRTPRSPVNDGDEVARVQEPSTPSSQRLSGNGTGRQNTGNQPDIEVTTPVVTPSHTTVSYPYPVYLPSSTDSTRIDGLVRQMARLTNQLNDKAAQTDVNRDLEGG